MLNYQLMKHTNQLISYYTKEIILYNYTCILGTSSINTGLCSVALNKGAFRAK